MKTPAFAVALLASLFLAAAPTLRADDEIIPINDAVLTGTIITNPATPNAPVVVTPLTKAVLLGLFGFSNVSSSKAFFFADLTNGTVILASKDGKTTYGTVLTLQLDQSHGLVNGKSGTQVVVASAGSVVGTDFNGTISTRIRVVREGKASRDYRKDTFIGFGTLDGASNPDAIISGTLQGNYVALRL